MTRQISTDSVDSTAQGPPEEIALVKESHTGRYLAKVLAGHSLIAGK